MIKKAVIGFLITYCIYLLTSLSVIYLTLKKHGEEITIFKIAQFDSDLGYKVKPFSHSVYQFPDGKKKCDVFVDENSFRTDTFFSAPVRKHPIILFLGCSFTFGDLCAYEDTYPYLVANNLNGTALNASVGGYGFAQMLLKAQTLIRQQKPDWIVFENTDWLIERSQTPFMMFYPFTISIPYFSSKNESMHIAKPLFPSPFLKENCNRFYETPVSISDYFTFVKLYAPALITDDFYKLKYLTMRLTLQFPKPEKNKAKISKFVFEEIARLSDENNAQLIIVGVNSQTFKPEFNVTYVDVEKYLTQFVDNPVNYNKEYAHWYGEPPQCFDHHPNELAHKRMAEALTLQMRCILSD